MLPLLIKDGQLVSFIALMIMYPVLYYSFYPIEREITVKSRDTIQWNKILPALGVSIKQELQF